MQIDNPQEWLPQQPPIMMLDSVTINEPGTSGEGRTLFHADAAWFQGHFPGEPILPGIYLIEALAQTCMVVLRTDPERDPAAPVTKGYLAKVDRASFYKPVLPGDSVTFRVKKKRKVDKFYLMECEAFNGEEICLRGGLTLAMDG